MSSLNVKCYICNKTMKRDGYIKENYSIIEFIVYKNVIESTLVYIIALGNIIYLVYFVPRTPSADKWIWFSYFFYFLHDSISKWWMKHYLQEIYLLIEWFFFLLFLNWKQINNNKNYFKVTKAINFMFIFKSDLFLNIYTPFILICIYKSIVDVFWIMNIIKLI